METNAFRRSGETQKLMYSDKSLLWSPHIAVFSCDMTSSLEFLKTKLEQITQADTNLLVNLHDDPVIARYRHATAREVQRWHETRRILGEYMKLSIGKVQKRFDWFQRTWRDGNSSWFFFLHSDRKVSMWYRTWSDSSVRGGCTLRWHLESFENVRSGRFEGYSIDSSMRWRVPISSWFFFRVVSQRS